MVLKEGGQIRETAGQKQGWRMIRPSKSLGSRVVEVQVLLQREGARGIEVQVLLQREGARGIELGLLERQNGPLGLDIPGKVDENHELSSVNESTSEDE